MSNKVKKPTYNRVQNKLITSIAHIQVRATCRKNESPLHYVHNSKSRQAPHEELSLAEVSPAVLLEFEVPLIALGEYTKPVFY